MTALAPNGVAIADYDPTGVGAIVTASITKTEANAAGFATEIPLGSDVSGSILRAASFNANVGDSNIPNIKVSPTTLPGVWSCLGYVSPLNDAAFTDFICSWMRVS